VRCSKTYVARPASMHVRCDRQQYAFLCTYCVCWWPRAVCCVILCHSMLPFVHVRCDSQQL
jgi:hypothetical protein